MREEAADGFLAEDLLGVGQKPDDGEERESECAVEDATDVSETVATGEIMQQREGTVERIRAEENQRECHL